MNGRDAGRDATASAPGGVRAALLTVTVLLFAEAAALAAMVAWLVIDLLVLQPSSFATAIALIVITALAAAWVAAIAVASVRRAPWARAGAIVWQVLQLSIAVGAFQGLFARPDIGWALLIPAVTVVGLLLWPPVRAAYARDEDASHPAAG
ncbi:hypothetical protein [Agromyces indicus]|uniref:Histidine kinase n=1 Tax=Agromyces indicus TaxID=758919 RepID=A0ABU1FNF6_9MICO|nr:hypothetical protein [Agromyces indicus]MDR5693299.1 hypothetical protein [Agromyces indicus]